MATAVCEQADNPVRTSLPENRFLPRSRFEATRHDVKLDDIDELIPFYAQENPDNFFEWLGVERDEVSIEDPEDIQSQYPPGYSNPRDFIGIGFLANAVDQERAGNLRASLAIIYRQVDEMVKLGMIDLLDEELSSVSAEEIGTDVLLGLLTATLPVKSRLPSRPVLFKTTKKLLKSRGHYEPGILDGLK